MAKSALVEKQKYMIHLKKFIFLYILFASSTVKTNGSDGKTVNTGVSELPSGSL